MRAQAQALRAAAATGELLEADGSPKYRGQMAQITLDQVDKTYSGGVKGIDGLSLEIGDGEFMVLVGPSGCGKSTAPRSIAGLEEISSGTISIGPRGQRPAA